MRTGSQEKPKLTIRPAIRLAVGNWSLRQVTENTASGKRAALQESHRHGIPGKRIGGSIPVQFGAARRARGGRGARRALPWLHVVRGTAVWPVSRRDECLYESTRLPHSAAGLRRRSLTTELGK